jgi:hypothetical protein
MSGYSSRLLRSMIWGWLDPTAMAGHHFVVESLRPLHDKRDETNVVIGDPVGLTHPPPSSGNRKQRSMNG